MPGFTTNPLNSETWAAYADLIERHNGVWGGCWCLGFHTDLDLKSLNFQARKECKHAKVCQDESHAALVFDGDLCVGWCQFGPAPELSPRNKFKRLYEKEKENEPDWRITCFFVDRKYRQKGVSSLALDKALSIIAEQGGGLVEAYPEELNGRTIDGRFIYLGLVAMFENRGFAKLRQVAKHHWVMTKHIKPTEQQD